MNYSKVDYEFLATSLPVDSTAARVLSKPSEITDVDDAREEHRNTGRAVDRLNRMLGDFDKGSQEREKIKEKVQELLARMRELQEQYPQIKRRKLNANDYILDECKKRMPKALFNACVSAGKEQMRKDALEGREIEGFSK